MSRPLPLNPWDEKIAGWMLSWQQRQRGELWALRGHWQQRHADFPLEDSRSCSMLNLRTPGLLAGEDELILGFESIQNFKSNFFVLVILLLVTPRLYSHKRSYLSQGVCPRFPLPLPFILLIWQWGNGTSQSPSGGMEWPLFRHLWGKACPRSTWILLLLWSLSIQKPVAAQKSFRLPE